MALDKPHLNEVSDSASLNEMSNLPVFHSSEQKLIEGQWPQALLVVDLICGYYF